jgi:HipA-like protein
VMAKGAVYNNGLVAGHLEKKRSDEYIFIYDNSYFSDPSKPSISLSLPKENREHQSKVLFPFFFGLLSEGVNKDIQCRLLKIDENDDFTRLLKTAGDDTIGAITVKEIND